jgi:hypothetical protein
MLFVGIFFLFFGKSNYFDLRLIEALWNLGHIAITFIAAIIINSNWTYFKAKPFWTQLFIIIALSFIVGVAVELLQARFGRDSSWNDVFLDFLGAVTAIAYFSNNVKSINLNFRWIRNGIILSLYLYALVPLISDSIDEIIQVYQFPVLSDLENSFEIGRWDVEIKSRSSMKSRAGKFSLKARVADYKYQGVDLEHFSRNWSKYKTFNISIYNTLNTSVEFSVKIYDEEHHKNPRGYNDRFNQTKVLKPGWNDIKIFTRDIQHGPKKRVMNLTKIQKVTVFPLKEQKPFYIFIDNVYLN